MAAVFLIPGRSLAITRRTAIPSTCITVPGTRLTACVRQFRVEASALGMQRLTWGRVLDVKQAGGHLALALTGGCMQQGNQTLRLEATPELPSLMQYVFLIGIVIGGCCFWESRQAVSRLGWRWHLTTVDDDSAHVLSNHLTAATVSSDASLKAWLT